MEYDASSTTQRTVEAARTALRGMHVRLEQVDSSVETHLRGVTQLRAAANTVSAAEESALAARPSQQAQADLNLRAEFTKATETAGRLLEGYNTERDGFAEWTEALESHDNALTESLAALDDAELPRGRTEASVALRGHLTNLQGGVRYARDVVERVRAGMEAARNAAGDLERQTAFEIGPEREYTKAVTDAGATMTTELNGVRQTAYRAQDVFSERHESLNAAAEFDVDGAYATLRAESPAAQQDPGLAQAVWAAGNPSSPDQRLNAGESVAIHQSYSYQERDRGAAARSTTEGINKD